METLDYYFQKDRIIKYLCKQRAKLAKDRSEDHAICRLSTKETCNYNLDIHKQKKASIINAIMPPRRSWVNVSAQKRIKNGRPLNSIEKNTINIFLTIKKHRQSTVEYPYVALLDKFIDDVLSSINSPTYKIKAPNIRPEFKNIEDKKYIYRPISSYAIKDSLIICFVNRYLSKILDEQFYTHAYAFRSPKLIAGTLRPPNHHDAFQRIIDYQNNHYNEDIYVAECDMKKFFDTVNHRVVLKNLRQLEKFLSNGLYIDKRAKRIFKRYLDSYTFPRNVKKWNNHEAFFKLNKSNPGEFGWLSRKEIRTAYPIIPVRKIGIPQGGALSGLIANIVLWSADKKVKKNDENELLYIRYCDDMIMMHTDKDKCNKALIQYESALKSLKLFPHPITVSTYGKSFWSVKSKSPYCWSKSNVPWVGFVGYEVNRNGEIRARKKSLKKEHTKQEQLVSTVINAIGLSNLKCSKMSAYESTRDRLIGMSVGRVKLWNYETCTNDLCWVNGFKLLNNNQYTRRQLRFLDRSKNRYLRKLLNHLKKVPTSENESGEEKNKQITYMGKPFSYYYHIIEKTKSRKCDS